MTDSSITEPVDPPTQELGYVTTSVPTPGWNYFTGMGGGGDDLEEVPELRWPNNVRVYHRMRTDAQIDALLRSVIAPLMRLNWVIAPNGAPDEVVNDISTQLNLPIQGAVDTFVQRGRKRFSHSEHLRLALLSPTVYGHMFFEMAGAVLDRPGTPEHLSWRLSKLAPRMPQTINRIDVAGDGGLVRIVQNGSTPQYPNGIPIPVSQLVAYPWEREGANWAGRSMMRPLYKYWLLKDRMLRVDAIKNERFGAGIPTGTAPPGGDPANYSKIATSIRASENSGVGLPNGATIGVEGIKGSLPDTLASIGLYNEEMARSFLAMFVNLGTTATGSRALGEQFVNFFVDALAAFANWYASITNEHVIEDLVDWNFGPDVQAPLLVWEERDEEPLSVDDLANLVYRGALVVDEELQGWIRKKLKMPDYKGGAPLPTRPATPIQVNPGGTGDSVTSESADPAPVAAIAATLYQAAVEEFDCVTCGSAADEPCITRSGHVAAGTWCHRSRLNAYVHAHGDHDQSTHGTPSKPKVTNESTAPGIPSAPLPAGREVKSGSGNVRVIRTSSQTVNSDNVGHREPNATEVAAATDFAALQQTWEQATTSVVEDWSAVRASQIDALVADAEKAVKAGDATALANLTAPVLGADVLLKHMTSAAKESVTAAQEEATAQGVAKPAVDVADLGLGARADAVAALAARGLGQSAANHALLMYGADGVTATDVGKGVRDKLEGLSPSWLNDTLGGAMTQAQNMARRAVINAARTAATKVYSSELLDENTCEECTGVDGTEYASMDDADVDYPAGGYVNCLGGPRCRGTLVAVYGEGD